MINILDEHKLLTESQTELLRTYADEMYHDFVYPIRKNGDILRFFQVKINIEPGIPYRNCPSELNDAYNFWKKEIERLQGRIDEESKRAIRNAQEQLKLIKEAIGANGLTPLRGLYDPDCNVIKLFPEEMQTEYNGTKMPELLVSTLLHETMHAYFNRTGRSRFPYAYCIEEPLAEFGMLVWLERNAWARLSSWALMDVSRKRSCYRFGTDLMNDY